MRDLDDFFCIQQRIRIPIFCWIKLMAEFGKSNGILIKRIEVFGSSDIVRLANQLNVRSSYSQFGGMDVGERP